MNRPSPGAAYPSAGEPVGSRFGEAEGETLAVTVSNPDGRAFLLAEGFDRLEATATSLSEAVEMLATSVAAITSRGDRIDRLVSENWSRLNALVDRTT